MNRSFRPRLRRPSLTRLRSRLKRRTSPIPYDMFSHERLAKEAKSAQILERVYHNGQDKIWNGKELLDSLIEKHGGIHLPKERAAAIRNIFSIILWGELAAWKISAELAEHIEPLEAKMAATAQAHDEARHFYVMHDYLKHLGYEPGPLPDSAGKALDMVLQADTLAQKIVGMQLMVEPIALTLFQMARESEVEPVLCELLRYYERDEARHVALGIHYLPDLIKDMNRVDAVQYWAFQARMFAEQLRGLRELQPDFEALGFDARHAFRLGQGKQLKAAEMLAENLGNEQIMTEIFKRCFDFLVVYNYPSGDTPWPSRFKSAILAAKNGEAKPGDLAPAA